MNESLLVQPLQNLLEVCSVAYAVSELGVREVIGIDVVETENRESWTHFLRALVARGLHGIKPDVASAQAHARNTVTRYSKSCAKAMTILQAGIDDALSFLAFPSAHQRWLWSTNPIEHLNREIRRRTRSVGVFPSVASAVRLISMILIEQTEEWTTERRYMSAESMQALLQPTRND